MHPVFWDYVIRAFWDFTVFWCVEVVGYERGCRCWDQDKLKMHVGGHYSYCSSCAWVDVSKPWSQKDVMMHVVPKRLGCLKKSLEDRGLKINWSGTWGSGVIGAGEGELLTSVCARETSDSPGANFPIHPPSPGLVWRGLPEGRIPLGHFFFSEAALVKARIRKLPSEKIVGDHEEQENSLWPKRLSLLDSTCWDRKNEGCAKLQMGDRKSYGEISLSMDTVRSWGSQPPGTEAYTTREHTMAFGRGLCVLSWLSGN